ncbi:MAG TPA: HD domain-containing phosphohydrolase [Acidobacteriaceae bacterium]
MALAIDDSKTMPVRVKLLVACVLAASAVEVAVFDRATGHHWPLFLFYLAAVLLTSGMKVCLLRTDSTMSVNFPFILLAVLQLSPLQAMAVAAVSVLAHCKFRVQRFFSLVQIAFNVANVVNATVACRLTFVALRELHLGVPPALAAGAIVYFLANTVPLAFIIAWTSNRRALVLWREDFGWFLPFYLVGAALSTVAYFLANHYGLLTGLLLVPVAYTMYRAYNAQIARLRDSQKHMEEMDALHMRTIESLAMAIEAKDQETHDHLARVRVYVTQVGEALKLSDAEMKAVKTAALLHDIGKLAVPERIINKPGKLTPEEFEKMKIHPSVGADILERVRFPYPVVPIVRAHHEWWNGMGYPDGLKGEAIPIGARILSVVDSFDAMASDRPYRLAMPLDKAMAQIRQMAGTQFDPRVVDLLEQHYVELEEQARREGQKLQPLDTEVRVERGAAPGAGFEQAQPTSAPPLETSPGREGEARPATDERSRGRPALSSHSLATVTDRLQALLSRLQAATAAGSPFSAEEVLVMLSSRVRQAIPFECLVVYRMQGDELVAQSGEASQTSYFSSAPVPLGAGISGWVGKHEQSIVNGNATVEPHYLSQGHPELELRSALALPLRDRGATVRGVLSLYSRRENSFSREDLSIMESIEPILSLALEDPLAAHPLPPETTSDEAESSASLTWLEQALEACHARGQTLALLLSEPAIAERLRERGGCPGAALLSWGKLSALLIPGAVPGEVTARIADLHNASRTSSPGNAGPQAARVGFACFPQDGETAQALLACAGRRMDAQRLEPQPSPAGVA